MVYCYQCADCPEQYIGETGRPIEEREKEHKQACERMETGKSAIAEHLWRNNHKANWKSCRIIDKAQDWRRRKNLESYHILSQNPKMNRDKGYLSEIYHPWICLLARSKKKLRTDKQIKDRVISKAQEDKVTSKMRGGDKDNGKV